jgi:hypothetical protein
MQLSLDDRVLSVQLAPWERALGLMRNLRVPLEDVSDVRVVADPIREAMSSGMKVGLRLPWLLFVARTLRLDQLFIVRRGQPGLSFAVRNQGALQRVLLSTPEAEEIARRLQSAAR